jgi:hypothetical protein
MVRHAAATRSRPTGSAEPCALARRTYILSVPVPSSRRPSLFPFLLSALCAALALHMAMRDPRYFLPFALIVLLAVGPMVLARWRMRKLLISGDVERVLGTWQGSIERVMYPETMAPLMAATAYAAYGRLEAARRSLERAVRGPAWEAAVEQRLFVETLLDTFEGDRQAALEKAVALERLPMPAAGPFTRKRIALLRRGVSALARAFAHRSTAADADVLRKAADASPLVHWAMRYAAAIVAIDHGRARDAKDLLDGAPEWPQESAFRSYHAELVAHLSG